MDDMEIGETKSRIAKQGRRAARAGLQSNELDITEEHLEPTAKDVSVSKAKSRVSGWAEETSQKSRKSSKNTSNPFEDERLRPKAIFQEEESDTEAAAIPQLEDQPEEDLIAQVADAPIVQISKVMTYRELDNDRKQATFLMLDNEVDLKPLSCCLLPEADLIEEDKPWDWEHLFTEVCSEIANISDKAGTPSPTELSS